MPRQKTESLPGGEVEGQLQGRSRERLGHPGDAAIEAPDDGGSQPCAWVPPPFFAMGRPREVSTRGDAFFDIRCHQQPTKAPKESYPPDLFIVFCFRYT